MISSPDDYSPINCEFHDVLESTATRRQVATLQFLDDGGILQVRHARIANLLAIDGAEYLETDTGERVRLDHLVSVDGTRLADFGAPE